MFFDSSVEIGVNVAVVVKILESEHEAAVVSAVGVGSSALMTQVPTLLRHALAVVGLSSSPEMSVQVPTPDSSIPSIGGLTMTS
jgi:hypothetical protein